MEQVEIEIDRVAPGDPPGVLNGRGKPCTVLGKEVSPLVKAQYNIIQALLRADRLLSMGELRLRSGHPGAVNSLKAVAKLPHWCKVIKLAGTTGGGYGIIDPR